MKRTTKLGLVAVVAVVLAVSGMVQAAPAGSLVVWGDSSFGMGIVPTGNDYVAVSAGFWHNLALKTDGTVVAWGNNDDGAFNLPSVTYQAISAGEKWSLGLKSDGTLAACGVDNFNQVSNAPAGTFTAISAGNFHGLAVRSDGTLAAWGHDGSPGMGGQVSDTPTDGGYIAVAAGAYHSVALKADGTISIWGYDNTWPLPLPSYHVVTGNPGGLFQAITAGEQFTIGIRPDGTLVGWGKNTVGETNVPAGTDYATIDSGEYFTVALKDDGTLAAWGDTSAYHGELTVPAGVFLAASGGGYHGVAIQVPEPATLSLLLLGGAVTLYRRRKV
jgi:hypothetical protein